MEINERSKISLGFLITVLGGAMSFVVLFASGTASKEYVKDRISGLEKQLSSISIWMQTIDNRLYEIQKELNNRKH